jgi:hypothetical protein
MKPGTYTRTEETKQKQSEVMKERIKGYDFEEIDRKRKETVKARGVKVGCPKGTNNRIKKGWEKHCIQCGTSFYVTKTKEAREHCSVKCSNKTKSERQKGQKLPWMEQVYSRGSKLDPGYKRYKQQVYKLTEKTYVDNIDIINPQRLPRTLCGVEGGYQLDHKKPIKECYIEGLTVEETSSIDNLDLIPWKENLSKRNFELKVTT